MEAKTQFELITIKSEDGFDENELSVLLKSDSDFHMNGFIWGHLAAKHVYSKLNSKLKSFEPKSRSEINEMIKAITAVTEFIEVHYYHEEEIAWKFLIEQQQCLSEPLLTIVKPQHTQWTEINNEMKDLVKSLTENQEIKDKSSNGWTESISKVKEILQKLTAMVYKSFYDEERIIIPVVLSSIPKSKQNKLGEKMNETMKNAPTSKFVLGAILDVCKTNKDLDENVKKAIPWAVRKVIFPLALEKNYNWFSEFVEIK
ncbi:hypothetical protein DDB_G0283871 [Dictyostelium discoideum AX4]|uniref:Uncharacterized protein DDB_G0283871 n=1 Tax=Dictyostelium discoideum TaxID=44689 RepID=Y8387_DICDI|nr:hypothetical protein DDB_G0283871 [Dictyostelium discoideum AX4]Q54QJ8.1 RecName: Full=Uncharacterized protein DDB_G0283871 [Dictyostelium discoideum]EAL65550.1 hypothetical protein DDB_G0283871 [Dictyostelium discoideum AX4]|eukprot:XP_638873.1 hypothetical protein DDB_G0283871 [Dictyostelium discoideum AX4]